MWKYWAIERIGKIAALRALGLSFLLALVACGGGGSGGGGSSSASAIPSPVSAAPVLQTLKGSIGSRSIHSDKTGATYPIYVYMPSDYAATIFKAI